MRKTKRIGKFNGSKPRHREDIKGIVAPKIGPKTFGTFEKQALVVSNQKLKMTLVRCCCINIEIKISSFASNLCGIYSVE